jgi:Cd2+/Zn2+-exporting ATPase
LIIVPPLAGFEPLRAHRSHWAGWFYQAMAFLTAASPCALAIGTPSAILCGIARSARIGVLLKGGAFLETLGRIDAIAFDKTGTLTQGRPMLTDIVPLGETGAMELLALAAALEHESNHPLAQAIVAEAGVRNCPVRQAVDVEQIPGLGIVGNVDGRRIALGQIDLLRGEESQKRLIQEHIAQLADQGKSTVLVAIDSQYVGILALSDRPRENARQTLAELKELGIKRTIMLTGDHKRAAAAIAAEVGVDEYFSDLLPEDKLSLIQGLRRRFRTVAMVGDGVNDAPALASASLGIAMGGAGSDVAIETADVVLMSSDLGMLPHAIGLSRRARRIILQNLLIALGVITVTAPAAALGLTSLGMAVLLHEGSTVVVVLNSLRLLAYKARGMPFATEAKVRESAPAAEQLETA